MERKKIKVKGMHCHGCEMLIKLTLSEIDGVKEVFADHTTGEVIVEYESKKVGIEKLFNAIKEAGYEPVSQE